MQRHFGRAWTLGSLVVSISPAVILCRKTSEELGDVARVRQWMASVYEFLPKLPHFVEIRAHVFAGDKADLIEFAAGKKDGERGPWLVMSLQVSELER